MIVLKRAIQIRVSGIFPAALFCAAGVFSASAQYDSFLMRSSPSPIFTDPTPPNYNLKWGPLTGRMTGSLQTEYNDNVGLDAFNPAWDVSFSPNVGVGFQWPVSPRNVLEFNIGFGYRAFINNTQLNSFSVTPDSRLLYAVRAGKVNLLFRDTFALQVDPLSRPDISGASNGSLIDFKQVHNDFGIQAEWQARSNLALVSSYDYSVVRSLNDQFVALDRDDHNFSIGGYSNIGPAWNVGINAATTITDYVERIQNDGLSFTVGPQVTVKVSKFITVDGNVGYTLSDYDQSGTINDNSSFAGASFGMGIRHTINSRLNHSLRGGRSISPGFGSNYNEMTSAQYGINWKINSFLTINSTFSYENLQASGPFGETADRYLGYVGTGWSIAKRWDLGLGYSFALKNSDQNARDYRQNRVSLNLTHTF